jgi:[citrate (pro-3S)-lyase] ligase
MVPAALPLLTSRERDHARLLVESQGLAFEDGCDDIVGIHDQGRLVATAARAGYVLKMFAIDEAWQGGETLGQLVTALADLARRAGHDSLLLYTRPAQAASFEAVGFRLLVTCRDAALLELGGGLQAFLDGTRHLREALSGRDSTGEAERIAAAVVINANPFTLGHQYLVETTAARVRRLYLFLVREDRSIFPFHVRYRLVRDGIAHLQNVILLDSSRYAISAGTFPSYFLKTADAAARGQMEVDARLFGAHIAPAFGVATRFVGTEPYSQATSAYNEVLAQVLPEYGVALEVVPRIGDDQGFSATSVREAIGRGDWQAVARLVPKTTLAYLRSREAAAITRRLGTGR